MLILKDDGTVEAEGVYKSGARATPPPGLTGVVAVAAGINHSLALKSDGVVVAWGLNHDHNGYFKGQAMPPPHATNVIAIAASGSNLIRASISIAAHATNVIAIAASGYHSLALKADGDVIGWGENNPGYFTGQAPTPRWLVGAVRIAAGWYQSLAIVQELPPKLRINLVPKYGSISWPWYYSKAILEGAPSLDVNANWTAVEGVGNPRLLHVDPNSTFFRLRFPQD